MLVELRCLVVMKSAEGSE